MVANPVTRLSQVEAKQVTAPFVPEVEGEDDTTQFDEYPDSETEPTALSAELNAQHFEVF